MLPVTWQDVLTAQPRVHAVLSPTPLIEWPGLSAVMGGRLLIKHENHQPVGAFKVRGGINLVSCLSSAERAAGIFGYSTGNHGQSLAFAARHFGARCTIVVPVGNNPDKNRAIRLLGAELIEHGRDFYESQKKTEELVAQHGGRFVHSANEPLLIAGVGTMTWEIFDRLPDPDVILVPIGLGSSVCGACIVARHRSPRTQVIGVQAENAAAVARTWQTGTLVTTPNADTWAEGLATRVPAEMTMDIMRSLMDDVLLVGEDDLRHGVYRLLKHTHNLSEGAGSATLAAAIRYRRRFQGRTVVAILSGGNLDLRQLPAILALGPQVDDADQNLMSQAGSCVGQPGSGLLWRPG